MNTLQSIVQHTWKGEMMKQWKILASAVVVAIAANTSFADDVKFKRPGGWDFHVSKEGRYESRFDLNAEAKNRRFILSSNQATSDADFVAITKTVDVTKLQGKPAFISVFLRGTPGLANKDVWIRYLGKDGFIRLEQVQIFEDDDPAIQKSLTPSFLKTQVPLDAQKMEIGMGLHGKGTLELGRLTFGLIQESPNDPKPVVREPLAKEIKKISSLSNTDPLKLSLDE